MIPLLRRQKMNRLVFTVITISVLLYLSSIKFRRNIQLRSTIKIEKLSSNTLARLKSVLSCRDRDFEPRIEMRSEFWILKNYVRANHDFIHCYESVTFTTHGTVDYLDHLESLVVQWQAPVSLAIHAPGPDFNTTIQSIKYLRNCLKNSNLISDLVTFHIFFSYKRFPKNIPRSEDLMKKGYDCLAEPPYLIKSMNTYMQTARMLYPINVARNVARDAAMTHFVLSSDIDFIPSLNLCPRFLKMIARSPSSLNVSSLKVYPLALFQLHANFSVLPTKLELKEMIANLSASEFGDKTKDAFYSNIPNILQWIEAEETEILDVLPPQRRVDNELWSPIFIGTHQDPSYDERLSWEGQNDRISQAYIMCVQNYSFLVLNHAFLMHSGNLKPYGRYISRHVIVNQQAGFRNLIVSPQLKELFGKSPHCSL